MNLEQTVMALHPQTHRNAHKALELLDFCRKCLVEAPVLWQFQVSCYNCINSNISFVFSKFCNKDFISLCKNSLLTITNYIFRVAVIRQTAVQSPSSYQSSRSIRPPPFKGTFELHHCMGMTSFVCHFPL